MPVFGSRGALEVLVGRVVANSVAQAEISVDESSGVEPVGTVRCVPGAVGTAATAACTDASGNYVGVDPDVSLDDYIGVESLSGHLLCPGARWRTPPGTTADPSRLARLVYSGTSDENLLLDTPDEDDMPAAADPLVEQGGERGELAFFGRDVTAFLRRLRTPADTF
jgi:hypothetical protein